MASKIGTAPNQLVIHAHLGGMAYQDPKAVNITGGKVGGRDATKLLAEGDVAKVATTGSYSDLEGKPTIPTLPDLATSSTDGLMSSADKSKLDAVGSMANRNVTISADDPSGGQDGDIWIKV